MALDIGLHLLGGDPMGFYAQPREVQVDLLAYWRLMNDRESSSRWGSMGPARLSDLGLYGLRSGSTETMSGLKAWLGGHGVRFRTGQDVRATRGAAHQLHLANARRCGASKAAVGFWLNG